MNLGIREVYNIVTEIDTDGGMWIFQRKTSKGPARVYFRAGRSSLAQSCSICRRICQLDKAITRHRHSNVTGEIRRLIQYDDGARITVLGPMICYGVLYQQSQEQVSNTIQPVPKLIAIIMKLILQIKKKDRSTTRAKSILRSGVLEHDL